jgi:hypothetical protein
VMATHDQPALGRALSVFAAVKRQFEAEHGPLAEPERTRAAGASRRQPGDCNMNATVTIVPTRPQYVRALERANEDTSAAAHASRRI